MKLNANKLALAAALSFALLWVICVAMVMLMPEHSIYVTEAMIHSSLPEWQWNFDWQVLLVGLIAWMVSAGTVAWFTATIYNRLIGDS